MNYIVAETDEYAGLVPFFIENGLEFTEEDMEEVPTDLVKCWEIREGNKSDGRLIGAFVLAKREGKFICDGIAVDKEYRKTDLGSKMLETGIAESIRQGGKTMFLVARAPDFFRKHGFETISREDAPDFFECLTCPQYGLTCHPEVMKKDLVK